MRIANSKKGPAGIPATVAAAFARTKPARILLGSIAVLALVCGGTYAQRWYTVGRFVESTDNAYLRADQVSMRPGSPARSRRSTCGQPGGHAGQPLVKIDAATLRDDGAPSQGDRRGPGGGCGEERSGHGSAGSVIARGPGRPENANGTMPPCATGIRPDRRPLASGHRDPAEERAGRKRAGAGQVGRRPEAGRARRGPPAGRPLQGTGRTGQGAARAARESLEPGRDRPRRHGAAKRRSPAASATARSRSVSSSSRVRAADGRSDERHLSGGQLQGNADRRHARGPARRDQRRCLPRT